MLLSCRNYILIFIMTQDLSTVPSQEVNSQSPPESDYPEKRMTITFPGDIAEHLRWLAEKQGISQAEAARKAVVLESYLRQALLKPDAKLLISDRDSVREIIIR